MCRIFILVHILQVPGNLIISARSASHSFDASQMNMSHVISHFSFGKKITPGVMSDLKRLMPYIGLSHDRLNGLSYISNPSDSDANVTVSLSSITLSTFEQDYFFFSLFVPFFPLVLSILFLQFFINCNFYTLNIVILAPLALLL